MHRTRTRNIFVLCLLHQRKAPRVNPSGAFTPETDDGAFFMIGRRWKKGKKKKATPAQKKKALVDDRRERAIKQNDAAWSLIIRGRAGFRCQLAGLDGVQCKGNLQAMHIITRGNWRLRWDLDNGICGCQAHHMKYSYDWKEIWIFNAQKFFPNQTEYVLKVMNNKQDRTNVYIFKNSLYLKQEYEALEKCNVFKDYPSPF